MPASRARGRLFWRVIAAAAVALVEYLTLSYRFDAQPLRSLPGGWAWLGRLGEVPPLLVVIAAVLLAVQAEQLRAAGRALHLRMLSERRWWPYAFVHGLAFLALLALTQALFGATTQVAPTVGLVVAWFLAASAVLGSLVFLVAPPKALAAFARASLSGVAAAGLLGAVVWAAGLGTEQLWHTMGQVTVRIVVLLLAMVSDDAWSDGLAVGVGEFAVEIAPVCSGYAGIGLMTVFMTAYVFKFRSVLRVPRAFILVPLGVLVSWLGNILRIFLLVCVGAWISPDIALNGFHSKAGWVFFCAIALGLVALSRHWGWLQQGPLGRTPSAQTSAPSKPGHDAALLSPVSPAPYLVPLMAILGASLVVELAATDFGTLYPLRILAGSVALWAYRRHYAASEALWGGSPSSGGSAPSVALETQDLTTVNAKWTWSWVPVGMGIAAFGIWMLGRTPPRAEDVQAWSQQLYALPALAAGAWLVVRAVGSSVIVPIAEELAFRGYLLRRLISPSFTHPSTRQLAWLPIVASSLAFGALHQRWIVASAVGVLYALVQQRRGSTLDAIVAHGVTNALVAAAALAGDYALWM